MTTKHAFAADQRVGDYLILGPAESKSGHARWHAECLRCGKVTTLRGAALAAGATCVCPPKSSHRAPSLEDVLAEVRALRDLVQRLVAAPAASAAPAAPAGTVPAKREPLTKQDIWQGATTLAERLIKFADSMSRAETLAALPERTPDQEAELVERLAIERDSFERDPDAERQTTRRIRHRNAVTAMRGLGHNAPDPSLVPVQEPTTESPP